MMKSLCCAAAMTLLVAAGAHADEWNKKTYLTFSGPVQIPGATLPAGTYLFQLADPDNARHVVMVASQDGSHVYGMFITIPNDRLETPDKSVVMFGEAPAGAPQAVQAWWYPGDRVGEEFVYPKSQATRLARANHRGVLATDSEATTSGSQTDRMSSLRGSKVGRVDENGNLNGEPARTTAENNTATSASKAQTTTAAATTTAPANTVDGRDSSKGAKSTTSVGTSGQANTNTAKTNTADNTARRSTRRTLPRTASNLGLFELLSGLSLAAAFVLRRTRAREMR